jgi:glycosyltransferase involved in cell wall biosynthesis
MLERAWPGLRPKLFTIYNTVDLDRFRPPLLPVASTSSSAPLRMVVVASYYRYKNMMGLARALHLLQQSGGGGVVVDWYGATPADQQPMRETAAFVSCHGLTPILRFHASIQEVESEYRRADAVGLFSEYEGLPNVVCEGMACGKPIVMSDVCDARYLVVDGKNGFLCDPSSPQDMAEKIRRLVALNESERLRLGLESRRMAERLFAEELVLERYERILLVASRHEPIATDCNWPTDVPESAMRTADRWARSA